MAKSYDRNSYGSNRGRVQGSRPSVSESGASANPRSRARRGNGEASPAMRSASRRSEASLRNVKGHEPSAHASAAGARQGSAGAAFGGAGGHGPGGAGGPGGGPGGPGGGNPYSRGSRNKNYGVELKRKKRKKILLGVLVGALVLVLAGAGAAFAFVSGIQSNLNRNVDDELLSALSDNAAPGEPFYMLLLGTDKSAERAADASYGDAFRTDSIMLLRVDPPQKKVAVVSLMRDTMVDMGENGTQKLNAAYAIGGAAYTVEVVSQMAGVPIAHYAEIGFDGFKDIVDALGGIEVNVPIEIDDADAGGHLDAGLQTLNGEQALILSRSRHAFDEIGKGDEYRAANQRAVIAAIAEKVLSSDLPTMVSTIEALSKHVTTDFSVTDIIALANSMRGMSMESDFYTAVNPTVSQYIDGIWWEVMDETAWREMMSRIEQGLSPVAEDRIDEATGMVMANSGGGAASGTADSTGKVIRSGTVSIRNGTSIDGAASAAQAKVEELGYTVNTGNANSTDFAQTVVVYNTADQQEYAKEIAAKLGVGVAVANNNEYLFETDFLVVIGSDWS